MIGRAASGWMKDFGDKAKLDWTQSRGGIVKPGGERGWGGVLGSSEKSAELLNQNLFA